MGNKHGTSYRPVTVPPPRDGAAEAPVKVETPPPPAAESAVEAGPAGVKVKVVRGTWYVQPSTGTRIEAGEEKVLANDGWLAGQIEARLLARVK